MEARLSWKAKLGIVVLSLACGALIGRAMLAYQGRDPQVALRGVELQGFLSEGDGVRPAILREDPELLEQLERLIAARSGRWRADWVAFGPWVTVSGPKFELRFQPGRLQVAARESGNGERLVSAELDPEEFEHFRAWLDRELPVAKAGR